MMYVLLRVKSLAQQGAGNAVSLPQCLLHGCVEYVKIHRAAPLRYVPLTL